MDDAARERIRIREEIDRLMAASPVAIYVNPRRPKTGRKRASEG